MTSIFYIMRRQGFSNGHIFVKLSNYINVVINARMLFFEDNRTYSRSSITNASERRRSTPHRPELPTRVFQHHQPPIRSSQFIQYDLPDNKLNHHIQNQPNFTMSVQLPPATHRKRALPQGELEAASTLRLGADQNTHTLSLSEARLVINKVLENKRRGGKKYEEPE